MVQNLKNITEAIGREAVFSCNVRDLPPFRVSEKKSLFSLGSTCPFEFLCLRIANDTCVLVDWRRGKLWLADVTTRDSAGESRKTPPFLNATPPKCHLLYYLTTAAPTLTELLSLDQVASNKNHLTQKSDI